MDWRVWIPTKFKGDNNLLALVGGEENIYAAGSIDGTPEHKPFVVVQIGPEIPGPFKGVSVRNAVIWAHDETGTYMTVDALLLAMRRAFGIEVGDNFASVVEPGAVGVRWTGDSTELVDDGYGTICRNAGFQLQGRTL